MSRPAAAGGLLDLRFELGPDGRTHLAERAQRFPLRLTVPLYLDPADPGMAFVYLQNPTGGVFAGDRLVLRATAGEGTRVHLTTSAATKLYRMERGGAVQRTEVRLREGAYVELVPEPLIPQAGSRFEQTIAVDLSPGASFVASELLAPGRFARGEAFEFDELSLATTLRAASGRELCSDVIRLEPRLRSPLRRGLLGGRPYLATLLVASPQGDAEALAFSLDESVRGAPQALAAAGVLPNGAGALVRVLAETAAAARSGLEDAWRAARSALLGLPLPPRRK